MEYATVELLYPNVLAKHVVIKGSSGFLHPDITVYAFTTIEETCTVGSKVVIGSNVFVGRGSFIGEGTRIQHGVFICRYTHIGKNVFIGPCVVLADDKHPRVNNSEYDAQAPFLDDECSIGAGVVILPGVHIGKRAIVGAGAVVTHNVPDGATVVGIPAVPVTTSVTTQTMTGKAVITNFEGFGIL